MPMNGLRRKCCTNVITLFFLILAFYLLYLSSEMCSIHERYCFEFKMVLLMLHLCPSVASVVPASFYSLAKCVVDIFM